MSRVKTLADRFRDLYAGQPWLDETFHKKLDDLTENQALTRPAPDVHAVAEIVAHVVAWRKVLVERLGGNPGYKIPMNGLEDWPPPETLMTKGWPRLRDELEETQRQILGLLNEKTDAFLDHPFTATGETFGYLIEGIIQHDLYHLGQIGLVVSMLKKHRPDLF